MPSAAFFAWASFILAWPLAAASLAISVAAVACALTLSSSPIGRLPFCAPLPPTSWDPSAPSATGLADRPQVLGAAGARGGEVVVVEPFGSVLVGTEVVVDVNPCEVVVVVVVVVWLGLLGVFAPFTGGAVVVVVGAAPATGAPSTCCAWV